MTTNHHWTEADDIQVPSTWTLSNWSRFGEQLDTDKIYEAIEEEYGQATCEYCGAAYGDADYACPECKGEPERPFPALNDYSGCASWWKILPKDLKP